MADTHDQHEDDEQGADPELSDALIALRRSLLRAQSDGDDSRIKFHIDHVDLTMQVSVTRTVKGAGGIKWHVLSLSGERSREQEGVQTLSLRLTPVVLDEKGARLPNDAQFISGSQVANEQ